MVSVPVRLKQKRREILLANRMEIYEKSVIQIQLPQCFVKFLIELNCVVQANKKGLLKTYKTGKYSQFFC